MSRADFVAPSTTPADHGIDRRPMDAEHPRTGGPGMLTLRPVPVGGPDRLPRRAEETHPAGYGERSDRGRVAARSPSVTPSAKRPRRIAALGGLLLTRPRGELGRYVTAIIRPGRPARHHAPE